MKTIYQLVIFVLLSLSSTSIFAQAGYEVSGVVTNEKGEPVKSATVFIGGSQRVTPTDENGRFKFTDVPQGTFQLSVQIIGYAPLTQNIIVKNAALKLALKLETKSITLDKVIIGKGSAWERNFKLFKEIFIGTSVNAKECVILNPKVINFSTKKGLLFADADDFLIIENKRLGYRLHYLLKDFGYDTEDGTALYDGQSSFEELTGTDDEKKQWAKNRQETYLGSLMHFLRSVYSNNVIENGFITRPMYGTGNIGYDGGVYDDPYKAIIKNKLVKFDSLVTPIDTSFSSLKFNQLYVIYNPKKAGIFQEAKVDKKKNIVIDNDASIIKLSVDQTIIDKKGSYSDGRNFLISGVWAKARVGDQLPVEYQPPFVPMSHRETNIPTVKILAALQKWTDSIPQEKTYLHLDKPFYMPGDTIWFKGYLTAGSRHQPSAISGVAYVDLIDNKNHLVKSLKLPVISGTVAGDIPLTGNITDGRYRVRAYTRWMLNADNDYFFDRTINIGALPVLKQASSKKTLQQTDVQFFPEGGSLINGIASRVGFKATTTEGAGTNVNGKITDNDGNVIIQFTTLHAGMGSFLLKPVAGKTYTAKIKFADSTGKSVALPIALNEGYALNVYQPNKDSVLVRIHASASLQQSTVNLAVQSSGEVVFATPVKITGPLASVWLDRKSFPSGIAQFTIFNNKNEPLNERIAFIKGDDKMQLSIDSPKMAYKSREHIQLNLSAKNAGHMPSAGNFSVAVIDESKIPVDESEESTIFTNILLTSDLKGYIEKPAYYFTADTDVVNQALDNLMLTQGYRRFEWKNLLDSTVDFKPLFRAEGLGSSITGLVTTLSHQPIPGAHVQLLSLRGKIIRDTTADVGGRFVFDKLFLIGDSIKFAVQGKDTHNTDKVMMVVDTVPQVKIGAGKMPVFSIGADSIKFLAKKQDDKVTQLKGLHNLNQVNIKAKKVEPENDPTITPQGTYKLPDEQSADQVVTIPDPEHYTTLEMFLRSRLQGIFIADDPQGFKELVNMRPPDSFGGGYIPTASSPGTKIDPNVNKIVGLIVDGRKINGGAAVDEILEGGILPEDVAKIEVVRNNLAMMSLLGAKSLDGHTNYTGYVLIMTKIPFLRKHYDPDIANIMPRGLTKVREFYSPRYDKPDDLKLPDLRTTIFWNPYLKADETGKAVIDFYNADGPADYRVVIEGINAEGQLGRQVFHYKVE